MAFGFAASFATLEDARGFFFILARPRSGLGDGTSASSLPCDMLAKERA